MDTIRIAVVSSNGIDVDLHFGQAKEFIIYEIGKDGSANKLEIRPIPEKTIHPAQEGGRSGGCCFHDDGKIEDMAKTISDCGYLLIEKIGNHPGRLLQREGIYVLEKSGNIEELLGKISQYYIKNKL